MRANRLIAELKVFFSWPTSLRGSEVGLGSNPAARLGDLRFPETPRSRKLDLLEIEWFLKAVAQEEERDFRRGMLLWLITAARISEVVRAPSCEGRRSLDDCGRAIEEWLRALHCPRPVGTTVDADQQRVDFPG